MIENNDVDKDISLDCLDPPTFAGRTLLWSGDGRVPHPGEIVQVYIDDENTAPGTVIGYFQAHGYLGVSIKFLPEEEAVGVFGSEVIVPPRPPIEPTVQ